MTQVLALFCTLIVAVSLLGGMLPLATVLTHTRLQVYLSFSAGSMLGAAFFHMLPETAKIGSPETVRWAAVGLLALFFLERFFSFHQHEPRETETNSDAPGDASAHLHDHDHEHDHGGHHSHQRHSHGGAGGTRSPLSWWTAAFGLTVHSLVGGVALASAVAADFAQRKGLGGMGWGVFLATVVHKPADALTIVSLMLRSRVSRRWAHLVNLGFAVMIPVGVFLFALGLGQLGPGAAAEWTSLALAFSAGTFLCIALSDLLPELQFHSHDRLKLSTALLAGFFLMAGTSVLEYL